MTHLEVVRKIVGNIDPTDDEKLNIERLANLRHTIALAEDIIYDIECAVDCCDDESSATVSKMKKAGQWFLDSFA